MPTVLFGSWAADLRLPIAVIFLAIAFMDVELPEQKWQRVFIGLVICLVSARLAVVEVAWRRSDSALADLRKSFAFVDKGSRILTSGAKGTKDFMNHAVCLAIIDRSCMVADAFTVPGKHALADVPQLSERRTYFGSLHAWNISILAHWFG
jgi:hypothetical protein